MSFLKSKEGEILITPLVKSNPIMGLTLGVCSALAVTVQVKPALVMSLSLTAVLICSNVIISCIRNLIPGKIRIITYMIVVASLVILADLILKAYLFDVSKQLSVFVGLIITNCIVMGRAEAFAVSNPPRLAAWDGLGNGLGYSLILLFTAAVREVSGSGKFYGESVVPQFVYDMGYQDNGLMLLAPGAFFIIGFIIWISNTFFGNDKGGK